jgi:hypothetical protein
MYASFLKKDYFGRQGEIAEGFFLPYFADTHLAHNKIGHKWNRKVACRC